MDEIPLHNMTFGFDLRVENPTHCTNHAGGRGIVLIAVDVYRMDAALGRFVQSELHQQPAMRFAPPSRPDSQSDMSASESYALVEGMPEVGHADQLFAIHVLEESVARNNFL